MEIFSLPQLFAAPAAVEANPSAKKSSDDGLCTRILNAIKSALAFFVSCLTCGKVKVFEAKPQNPAKPLPPPPQAKSPLENQIEAAAKAAKIDDKKSGHELLAFIFLIEILEKVCAPGEHLQISSSEDHVLTLTLPKSLTPLTPMILQVANRLEEEYLSIFDQHVEKLVKVEEGHIGSSINFIFRARKASTLTVNAPKYRPRLSFRIFTELTDKRLNFSSLREVSISSRNSHLIAASIIYDTINSYRIPTKGIMKADKLQDGTLGLFLEPERKLDHETSIEFEFSKKLLKYTWQALMETLAPLDETAQIAFSYDEHRNALILDQSRLTTR